MQRKRGGYINQKHQQDQQYHHTQQERIRVLPERRQHQYQRVDQPKKQHNLKKPDEKAHQRRKRRNRGNKQNNNQPNSSKGNNNNNNNKNNNPQQPSEYVKRKKRVYIQKSQTNTQVQSSQINPSAYNDNEDDRQIDIINQKIQQLNRQDVVEEKFKDLFLAFEDEDFYQRKTRRISLIKQYGEEDERLMKRALKRYLNDMNIKRIDQINLLIDQAYPYIEIECKTQKGKQRNINLVKMFKQLSQEEFQKQLKRFIRQVFYSNYTQVQPKQLNDYFDALQAKIKDLRLICDFYVRKDRNVKNIMACYCSYQDQFNLLAIDHYWNQVRLNNVFLQLNKNKFTKAYKICYELKKSLMKDEQIKQGNAALGGNEQLSSDEQDIVVEKPNMEEINEKLNELLEDNLDTFENDIAEKQAQQQQLRMRQNDDGQQQLQKIMEEISQLDTNLNDYKQRRKALKKEYQKLKKDDEKIVHIYKELRMLRTQLSSKLPIIARKKQLFQKLDKSNIVVLEGETGSGKSTQLPQMLCEYYKVFSNKNSKRILLTQPRKIATRTLAERVAMQLGEKVHGFVDYVSSTGKKPQKHSKIVLMLDRLLLDQLQSDPLLSQYHCLVVDEAHQRTLSIDILIGLVQKLHLLRPDFKIIITSATLDAILFEKYFQTKTFKVSGRMFPVEIIYKPYDKQSNFVDKIKKVLNDQVLRAQNKAKYKGHILVFCASVEQINKLCIQYSGRLGIKALPLHGKLTTQEQRLIFEPQQRLTKLIFSTRIAETAVTIDKVKVVIDPGEDRQTVYDQKKKITAFELKPISKSAAKQRAGRAGRTSAGYCFRLYSSEYQQKNMTDNKNPQIKSVPLDTLVLRLKQLKIKDILNFRYLQSPDQEALRQSQERMQIIGCLDVFYDITEIGLLLVKIPIEPFMSRALAQGIIIDMNKPNRKVLPQLLKTLVMIVNGQSIFYSKYGDNEQRQELQKLKFYQFADKQGDFFSLLKVYESFQEQLKNRKSHNWCKQKYLNKKTLMQSFQLYKQVKQILDNVNLNLNNCRSFEQEVMDKQRKLKSNKDLILACILPSFCEQLCLFSGKSKIGYTSIKRQVPLQIYGSSFLSLQGINPKWIISFDVFKTSNMFCRLAQSVSFDLLKIAIPPRLFKRYKIEQCQKINPFYQIQEYQLSTVLFDQLNKSHKNNATQQLKFLQKSTLLFYENLNKVEICFNPNKSPQMKQKFESKLKDMKNQIQIVYQKYTHHYLGSVTSIMNSGCKSDLLNFFNYLYAVKIYNLDYRIQYSIQVFYRKNVVKTETNGKGLIVYFQNQQFRKQFREWLEQYKRSFPSEFKHTDIKMQKGFEERRDKIATVKLKVRFFIGEPRNQQNFLLMGYSKDEAQTAQIFISNIDAKEQRIIKNTRINTKNKQRPLITVWVYPEPSQMDEVDFEIYLDKIMKKNNVLGWKPPSVIKGFRTFDSELARKTDQEWISKIKSLIDNVDQSDINIKGYGPKNSQFNTQITATIKMYDTLAAEQFKQKYNKKKGTLGNQKMHVQITYSQTMVKLSPFVFQIFKIKFNIKKLQMQSLFLDLKIQQRRFTTKRGDSYVVIESFSNKRQDLVRPVRTIKQIFKAQNIPLDPLEKKILDKKIEQVGRKAIYLSDQIFDQLRFEFGYNIIEFQIPRKTTYVKIYSTQDNLKDIQTRLKQKIKEFQKMMIKVSYKGKNIHAMIKILDRYKTKKQINYAIVFSSKYVQLFGGLEILSEVQNQIMKLQDQDKGDCLICSNLILSPYCLFNCEHTFCKFCLISSIRSISHDISKYPLKCPDYESCKTYININDLKNLFDQQQFDSICDRGVQKQIDEINYHGCSTQDCQMIFQVKESKKRKSFKCDLCTIHYCFQCKDYYHPWCSCEEYKQTRDPQADQTFKQMGIKRCRNCRSPIEKNGGCNHVTCAKCDIHICWKCQKTFGNSRQCYDHLAKACGGIFDEGVNQNQQHIEIMRMPRNQNRRR